MTEQVARTVRSEPRDPRFAAALDAHQARTWADPAFPYDLAGAGTATKGAAAAPEALAEDGPDTSGNGHQVAPTGQTAPAGAPATRVIGAVFLLEGDKPGAIGAIIRPGYLRGEVVQVALLRDLALPADPAAGHALFDAAVGFAREQGAAVAVVGSRESAAPLADLAQGWGEVPAFARVQDFKTLRVIPSLWRWEEPEYKVLAASRTELPALAYMLDFHRKGLAFAPPVDEASFGAGIERCPNLKITDFRIARYKGELVAMAGVWEPGAALPTVLEGAGPAEAIMTLLGKILGRLSPSPRLPGVGAPLRVRFVRSIATKPGHQISLAYLLKRIYNETRKVGAHAFEITLPAGDEQLSAVPSGVRRIRTPSIWAASLRPDVDLADLGPVDPGILDPGF